MGTVSLLMNQCVESAISTGVASIAQRVFLRILRRTIALRDFVGFIDPFCRVLCRENLATRQRYEHGQQLRLQMSGMSGVL